MDDTTEEGDVITEDDLEGLEEVNEIEDKTVVEDEVAETEDEEDVNLLVDAVDSTDKASENSE